MKLEQLMEAKAQDFFSEREDSLKKLLIKLLRDDGRGHYHAKFAERLKDFDVKIVALKDDPEMTAAMDFDNGIVYISEGFLLDRSTFFQLNLLLRHEIGHYLLQHQIRMMYEFTKHYGDQGYAHIKLSKLIHDLTNVLADYEISNKIYLDDGDKDLAQHLVLNGEVIKGLVTEQEHDDWLNKSLIEMYQLSTEEIEALHSRILAAWAMADAAGAADRGSALEAEWNKGGRSKQSALIMLKAYANINRPTNFLSTIDDYIKDKGLYHFVAYDSPAVGPCIVKFSSLPDLYQELIINLNKEFSAAENGYVKQDLRDLCDEISKSGPLKPVNVVSNASAEIIATLYTPEEKLIAIDVLKAIIPQLEQYQTWYNKIKAAMGDNQYPEQDLRKILDALNN